MLKKFNKKRISGYLTCVLFFIIFFLFNLMLLFIIFAKQSGTGMYKSKGTPGGIAQAYACRLVQAS